MNNCAALRVLHSEVDLRILPLERARADWDSLVASSPDASLYHRAPWLEVLRRAFGVRPSVALMKYADSTVAGCLLARGGNPLRCDLISLPFSDYCPPLATNDSFLVSFMATIAYAMPSRSRLEIRGLTGSAPWHVADHFQRWTLDLSRPFQAIERAADRETRRHVRRAHSAGVTVDRWRSVEAITSFFKLQLESRRRLGVPSQPLKFFKTVHEVFGKLEAIEVWFASHQGQRVAGVVTLRDGAVLHAKWSARVAGGPDGASHSIFMSIAEQYAQQLRYLDFGRTDKRNRGLSRFKRELGADVSALPYTYFPRISGATSAEQLTGMWQAASRVWRNLPLPLARALSTVAYRYLA